MIELETMARPYAKALYNISKLNNKTNIWLKQIEIISKVSEDVKISRVLSFPELSAEEKGDLLIDLLESEDLDDFIKNFIYILAENGRIQLFSSIFYQFKQLVYIDENIIDATVYSAFPIDEHVVDDFVEILENSFRKKIVPKLLIDNSLIGGIKIEFGDKVLDMSIQSKLMTLKKTMLN